MSDPLVRAWWEGTSAPASVKERADMAIALIREGKTRHEATGMAKISRKSFYRYLDQQGLRESLPKCSTGGFRGRSTWPVQEAKTLLWRGASEEEVAKSLGMALWRLQQGMRAEARYCRSNGKCLWCEVLLEHVAHDGAVCADCARVLRGEPLFPEDVQLDALPARVWGA